MSSEFELVRAFLQDAREREVAGFRFVEGKVGGETGGEMEGMGERGEMEVVLVRSGIGKVCAAMGTVEMLRVYAPEAVVNTGVAGGIDAGVGVMDVVVGRETVYHDVWCGDGNVYGQVQGYPARFEADVRLYEAALAVDHEGRVLGGLICSGDQFVTSGERLREIKLRFPEGLAVDMESCAIAQVCYHYGVPFLSYRIISDTPGGEHHFSQYLDFWEEAPRRSFGMLRGLLLKLSEI